MTTSTRAISHTTWTGTDHLNSTDTDYGQTRPWTPPITTATGNFHILKGLNYLNNLRSYDTDMTGYKVWVLLGRRTSTATRRHQTWRD